MMCPNKNIHTEFICRGCISQSNGLHLVDIMYRNWIQLNKLAYKFEIGVISGKDAVSGVTETGI